ncbi:MAG: Inward rectifier potassium channel Irk [Chitinophagaceae bacterium]|nr:Inward rectifier potassium channel Irk [Chitinophagaceae bacterium]
MALHKRVNASAKTDETTGFGTNRSMYGGRLINRDGKANVHKTGISFFDKLSWYHTLIQMPRWKFLTFIFIWFLVVNLVFAGIYYLIGVENLGGMEGKTVTEKFIEAYFFSAQTFTTVGYGRINPTGYLTSFVAAFEAFSGLLFFALATGLFYARFSRPEAFLRFSENALIAPYRDGIGLMCRIAPYKNNSLTELEVKLTVAMRLEENGKEANKFYQLEMEISKVNALALSWTIVHPINDKSPLYTLAAEDFKNLKTEVFVMVKAFDETFSNTVVARTSYTNDEIVFGAKFIPMYRRSVSGGTTILELDKLNHFEKADITMALPGLES